MRCRRRCAALRWLGPCYVQAFNRRHRRSGTLWEGRFKSCLVDTDRYLLTVIRYIELNPVRARIAESAEAYRWSSVRAHLNLAIDPLLTPHPTWRMLGQSAQERAQRWREWLLSAVSQEELASIRKHLRQQRALGEPRFQAMVETALGRPACTRPSGRPVLSQG